MIDRTAAPRARHRAVFTGPTILRSAALPWRTRVHMFLVALAWHARLAVVRAVTARPRWTSWREDLALAAVGCAVTAVVVPLVIWALEAWLR